MKLIDAKQFDQGSDGGDNNLNQLTQPVSGSTQRVTNYAYDWRNRQIEVEGELDYFEKTTYDNLNRAIQAEQRIGSAAGQLLSRSQSLYDPLGRLFRSILWGVDPDTGSVTSPLTTNHWFDPAGNRLWRENPSDSSRRYDWLYSYDGLHRLHTAERGELNSGHTAITSPQFGQCWTLDPTGNWEGFRQDDNGNGTWNLIQARTANPVNEITDIDNTTGSNWKNPSYHANGNMTAIPSHGLLTSGEVYTQWDAWDRLVKVINPRQSRTMLTLSYDGRNYRVKTGRYNSSGTLIKTIHHYFTDAWQCVEQRVDSSSDAERQHVWGLRYIDDLVLRDRDTTGNGTLDERLYAMPDANWNVTGVVNTSGVVQERIEYTPYGRPQFLAANFTPRSSSDFDWRTSYTGREWESAVWLYDFRHRWYIPLVGVFASRDAMGYDGSRWNLQEFLQGQPLSRTDPSGLQDQGPLPRVPGTDPTLPGNQRYPGAGRLRAIVKLKHCLRQLCCEESKCGEGCVAAADRLADYVMDWFDINRPWVPDRCEKFAHGINEAPPVPLFMRHPCFDFNQFFDYNWPLRNHTGWEVNAKGCGGLRRLHLGVLGFPRCDRL
jgi:RHS repeat-associated protein